MTQSSAEECCSLESDNQQEGEEGEEEDEDRKDEEKEEEEEEAGEEQSKEPQHARGQLSAGRFGTAPLPPNDSNENEGSTLLNAVRSDRSLSADSGQERVVSKIRPPAAHIEGIEAIPPRSKAHLKVGARSRRTVREDERSRESRAHRPHHHLRSASVPEAEEDSLKRKTDEWADLLAEITAVTDGGENDTGPAPPPAPTVSFPGIQDTLSTLIRPGMTSSGKLIKSGVRPFFSQDLADVVVDERSEVPCMVVRLCDEICKHVPDASDFLRASVEIRKSPSESCLDQFELSRIRTSLDQGEVPTVVANESLIAILFEWLSRLPCPLLRDFQTWLKWSEITDQTYRLRALSTILHSHAPESTRLILFILRFMQKFLPSERKLTTSISGVVLKTDPPPIVAAFAPFLLRDDRSSAPRQTGDDNVVQVTAVPTVLYLVDHIHLIADPRSPLTLAGDLVFYMDDACRRRVRAGTLDRLIEIAADDFYNAVDPDYRRVLFFTHEYFVEGERLLSLCLELISRCDSQVGWQRALRARTLKNLKLWLREFGKESSARNEIAGILRRFFEGFETTDATETTLCDVLLGIVQNFEFDLGEADIVAPHEALTKHSNFDFILTAAQEIAVQLTYIDSELFASIPASEFLMNRWTEQALSPNYHRMVDRFNLYSKWIWHDVLASEFSAKRKDRIKVVSQWCKVARFSLLEGNFHAAYAILAALDSNAISRLTKTWRGLCDADLACLSEVREMFDFTGTFRKYRHELENRSPPVVPWIGLLPKDLVMAEELDTCGDAADVVNFNKMRVLYRIISPLVSWQQEPYRHRQTASSQVLRSGLDARAKQAHLLDEKTAFALSRRLEK